MENEVFSKQTLEQVDQAFYQQWKMSDWRELLPHEVNVYVYGNSYIAKRFDSIAFEFCGLKEAKEILEDNIYMLLKYKYFKTQNNTIDKLVQKIVQDFTVNIKTTLIKVSFEREGSTDNKIIKDIPQWCVAFRNGVYDFKNNKWLFKVNSYRLDNIQNVFYEYDNQYIILWYINIEFGDLGIDITKLSIKELLEIFNYLGNEEENLCFNLIYNMSFTEGNNFDLKKFQHLSEILGFTLSSQFMQQFIMFIGSGSNGKNSLLDGCFSSNIWPRPASISLDTIEEDRFVTGSLENKYHNFFLESTGKTYNKTESLKALTGSTQHSIERKGENKRSGYLNVKHIFSGNDRDKIKFGDSTTGFIRRINLYEVFYKWDPRGDYLKIGKYLKVNLSPDLRELRSNIINPITYVYIGMWGMFQATKGFTQQFVFSKNDYVTKYENIDHNVKKLLSSFMMNDIVNMILTPDSEATFYVEGKRIYQHPKFKRFFKLGREDNWKNCINNINELIEFLEDKSVWINCNRLHEYAKIPMSQQIFNGEVLKYTKGTFQSYFNNQKYTEIKIIGQRIKF